MKDRAKPDVKERPVYRQVLRLRTISPVVFYTLAVLLLANLVLAFVVPLVVPEQMYLSLYLSKEARERTERFRKGEDPFLVYDAVLGWRNRSNVARDKWIIDGHGARTTHEVGPDSARKRYVMFLGNSLVNGGTGVSNEETLSAYIEDASTESINFATMLYSFDQVYLASKHRLGEYHANVLVVGLPGNATAGLRNRYVPFRMKAESNMPFFKPRFEVDAGEFSILPVFPIEAYESILEGPEVLKNLERTDAHYREFDGYKRFGLMPFSWGVYSIYKKMTSFVRLAAGEDTDVPLLKQLMGRMVIEARKRNAKVIFVALPDIGTVAPNFWRRYLPDHYGRMVEAVRGEGYNLIDGRQLLRKGGIPPWELFSEDGLHYSSVGNRVIAAELKARIENLK